jgi:hypothetical protein
MLWVMRQVGHADSKMTMDVYAQLQQRAERQHGEAFDALVRRARVRFYGTTGRPTLQIPSTRRRSRTTRRSGRLRARSSSGRDRRAVQHRLRRGGGLGTRSGTRREIGSSAPTRIAASNRENRLLAGGSQVARTRTRGHHDFQAGTARCSRPRKSWKVCTLRRFDQSARCSLFADDCRSFGAWCAAHPPNSCVCPADPVEISS